jgi:putative membrane protein
VTALDWTGVHPRAFWRVFRRSLVWTAMFQLLVLAFAGWRGLWLAPVLLAWDLISSRLYTRNLGWTTTRDVVAFKTGKLVRVFTLAPLVRVQSVSLSETPFDRRTKMARISVDTAGTGGGGYDVAVPYLPRDTARDLYAQLSAAAATTVFQW